MDLDTAISEPLPSMPQLNQLFLFDHLNQKNISNFLLNNSQINSLSISAHGSISMIDNVEELKSLTIFDDSIYLEESYFDKFRNHE